MFEAGLVVETINPSSLGDSRDGHRHDVAGRRASRLGEPGALPLILRVRSERTSCSRLDDKGAPSPRGKLRVDADAAAALANLLAAAREAGHKIRINSAYRSYRDQARVFRTMKERGRAARPGHSEHQLGTAIDLKLPTTAAIDWLGEHAYEFGFALSYPPGKQRLTGYRPEPWHIRFVGNDVAAELHRRGWTLEELFHARPELGESGTCGTVRQRSRAKRAARSPPPASARGQC